MREERPFYISEKDKMAAARRRAWIEGQAAGSPTRGQQLEAWHRRGHQGHTEDGDNKSTAFQSNLPSCLGSHCLFLWQGSQRHGPLRNTNLRSDVSKVGGHASPLSHLSPRHVDIRSPQLQVDGGVGNPMLTLRQSWCPKVLEFLRRSLHLSPHPRP